MKATGIVRKIDDLGRIVLPIELRRTLGMEVGTSLEIFVDDQQVILQKYTRGCCFCSNSNKDLKRFLNKDICEDCVDKLRQLYNE